MRELKMAVFIIFGSILREESDFKNKSDGCAMYLQSTGKNMDLVHFLKL